MKQTKIEENFLNAFCSSQERGTNCIAIRFSSEPLLMFGGNKLPSEHCTGYVALRDPELPEECQHLTLNKIVCDGEVNAVMKWAAFNFAEMPSTGILADLSQEPETSGAVTMQRIYVIDQLYLHGEFFAGGTRYHFQIAYIALGPAGGEGGILISDNIYGQRQMRSMTRMLLHKGDDQSV
ncbi:MAG: hypothetical protein Q3Y08_10790 [Butyricicoccus sp.]|nr:hypothetical protein [Butyricicoccus sp.]